MDRTALEDIAALLDERVGLKIGPDGLAGLRLALSARLAALGDLTAAAYLKVLKGPRGDAELRSLLPLVTVGKTDFFRDDRQFEALEKLVLPQLLIRIRQEGRQARIWSAGCATGEEPYSLSILLAELGASDEEAEIVATDLNPAAVDRAQVGVFPARRMSGLSQNRIARFFDAVPEGYRARPSIARRIRFGTHNLADPDWGPLGGPRGFDLILCRNVIIYFGVETIRRVMDRFNDALRPDGFLFLGYSESLFKVYDRFRMVEVGNTFVYRPSSAPPEAAPRPRLVQAPAPVREPAKPALEAAPAPTPQVVPPPEPVPAPRAPVSSSHGQSPADRIAEISAWVEQGGFERARERLERWLEEDPDQLVALLTLGNLHGLTGDPARARECFERVLTREPLCVDAHVFGGVAAFQAGALGEARRELTRALFLEPTLALAHYLLAQVEERLGELTTARRNYRNAIAQLKAAQRPLAGFYPDLPEPEAIERAARYALSALEERGTG